MSRSATAAARPPLPESSAPPSSLLWTPAQVEALTTMWADQAAPAQIAADLNALYGTTRTEGAIRTKAMHLGLPRLGMRTQRSTAAAKVIALAAPAPAVEAPAAPMTIPEPAPAPVERPRGVLLQDLWPKSCHYPVGEDRQGGHLMCGEPREDLSPYCTEHHRICTTADRQGKRGSHYPAWPRPDAPAGKPAIGGLRRGSR